ncbi:MAG: PPP family 3-phenylpropionic acid transporter [Cellvibrionaceae bacterium]|jgi:PPP family 3-phenylpropionic acid transporter
MIAGIPYWHLASFYFFYFALVGALNPYLSLYLTDIGFTAQAIGAVNGVLMGTKIVAPNLWGWLCDKTGKRLRIISLGSFVAMMCFGALFYWQSLISILIITFLYSFFWNAVLSQFDTITIQYLREDSHRYSQVRVWGSIGFIASVTLLGWLFDYYSIHYLIPISWGLLVLIWLSTLSLKEPLQVPHHQDHAHWFVLLKNPAVIAFFIAAFLLQFSFGAYYSFFSLHLESYGYSLSAIGLLWALGVLCEVALFLYMHKILSRIGVTLILFVSLLLTALRWLIIAFFADSLSMIVFAQTIHALSFGAAHAACIELIRRFFKGPNAGQGQALYSAITFGAGGALGAVCSGFLWDISAQLLFSFSAAVVLIAALVAWYGLYRNEIDLELVDDENDKA